MRSLVLALLATFVALTAVAQSDPLRPAPQDKAFAKLRGITQFYIDVTTSENRPEDADLRTEIRDGMELELRRANLTPKSVEGLSQEAATPLLLVDVRYDRGLGRYTADVTLSVRDNATITRNKKPSSPSLTANLAAPSARRTPRSTARSRPAAANSCWRSSTA